MQADYESVVFTLSLSEHHIPQGWEAQRYIKCSIKYLEKSRTRTRWKKCICITLLNCAHKNVIYVTYILLLYIQYICYIYITTIYMQYTTTIWNTKITKKWGNRKSQKHNAEAEGRAMFIKWLLGKKEMSLPSGSGELRIMSIFCDSRRCCVMFMGHLHRTFDVKSQEKSKIITLLANSE